MKKTLSAEDYFKLDLKYAKELILLREIVLKSGLHETVKWGVPTYTLGKDNVLALLEFKGHFCLWFYQGSLLADPTGKLINASPEKTVAMRQLRMKTLADIDEKQILSFIYESIENFKHSRKIVASRSKELIIPTELSAILERDIALKSKFEEMKLTFKREYCEYIELAKRQETKQTRLEKIAPMILAGIGLNDKYR